MILSVLCIYKHHTWTWYHWLGSIGSWGEVDFDSITPYSHAALWLPSSVLEFPEPCDMRWSLGPLGCRTYVDRTIGL